jgi:hypothetical protein
MPSVRVVRYTVWTFGVTTLGGRFLIHIGPWDVILDFRG